jgi:hypothetical protein
MTYSDPGCAWCGGTATGYHSAPAIEGPWEPHARLSERSCRGQPASAVAPLPSKGGNVHLFISDQWTNLIVPRPANWTPTLDYEVMGHRNQAEATQHWEPLQFREDGTIAPLRCTDAFRIKPA